VKSESHPASTYSNDLCCRLRTTYLPTFIQWMIDHMLPFLTRICVIQKQNSDMWIVWIYH